MKKYVFILPVFVFLLSCKTQSNLDDTKIVFNDVLENAISLDAVQLQQGKAYMGQVRKNDSIYVYGNVPQTVIDSVMNARKLENIK